ncbi:uncharacterized protein L203_106399 [Cryptococcus depauperatus CBS 7841]|uniref:Uncharacterized protein n=1 Tax=Cryptococcus depauperatus CBS 7841 TaxID=1295531 RepID=A0AAJ8JZ94_9TREE
MVASSRCNTLCRRIVRFNVQSNRLPLANPIHQAERSTAKALKGQPSHHFPDSFHSRSNMLTTLLTLSAMTLAVVAGPVHVESLASRSETHAVELINNCGSGEAVFLYAGDLHARGSGVIHGPLNGGVAWVDGWKGANCLASGKNCGIVEFSLLNAQTSGMSSADYSLLDGPDLGNHKFIPGLVQTRPALVQATRLPNVLVPIVERIPITVVPLSVLPTMQVFESPFVRAMRGGL